ncbi:hypothetical protein [Microbispora rosea]|uniref:hypothetical protein n=1 Tax=Microbispora rosea TaxID=58117 RepID=UPI0037938C14
MSEDLTGAQILDTPMQANDADAATIRDYLIALLALVWDHGEGFNGKRPFGNSGWEWELYAALARAGHLDGKFDEDGYLDDVDDVTGRKLISEAIRALSGAASLEGPAS